MKTIPPRFPKPEHGRQYWRGLDELADTPDFRQWVEREFPAGASECADPLTRRHFMKIMSASFLLAGVGLTGCRRPVQTIYPFAKAPENYTHGLPQFYATAMPSRGHALPLLAKSYDGRPIKLEGNAEHPETRGGTDHYAQASILNLYDPDRAARFTHNGNDAPWATVQDFLNQLSKQLQADGGQGLCVLLERNNSPSRQRLQSQISQRLPKAQWFVYEPIELDAARAAATVLQGKPAKPYYRMDRAQVILSLDNDFLGTEEESHRFIRSFAGGRKLEKPADAMNRLYAVEGLMTLTGLNADHRLRVPASAVVQVAALVTTEILQQSATPGTAEFVAAIGRLVDQKAISELSGQIKKDDSAWISKWTKECARDLLAAKGRSLILAGYRQPLAVQLMALAMNFALGNAGTAANSPLVFQPETESKDGTVSDLAKSLDGGQVKTLVILGGNPVYNAPVELEWAKTQRKAQTVVRLGYYEDETFPICDWHLPAAHFLESWGDARAGDGSLISIQPLIEPLFGGLTELEVLARLGGLEKTSAYEIVRETFNGLAGKGDVDEAWKKFLHDGFLANSAAQAAEFRPDWSKAVASLGAGAPAALPSKEKLELVFHRDYSMDDGRYNNNGWLQEWPDPITKLSWDNAILLSRRTAEDLGVSNEEVLEISLGGRTVQGPVWVQPGMADYTLGLALGYGRERTGRVGRKIGFNVYPLRTGSTPHFAVGASVRKTNERYALACTQSHWSMEGRAIVREANLKQYQAQPDFAKRLSLEEPPSVQPLYPNPLDKLKLDAPHQWGMSIDLNACVGCSACVLACQSENNIPIVGKEQVIKGREMHWVRIDRYYTGEPTLEKGRRETADDSAQQRERWIDDPQVVAQPMLCQHCEAAPCENVCPVNATVHNDEGLNVMVYNRCVGTRYCSNNCPYKVRRFNFFDYNKRPIQDHQLYYGPLAKKPADEWEIVKLVKNPDVTIRMRGVMEKCSFCLQRIEQAKIAQKIKAGASGNIEVPDGTIQTACQQACPAEAIVFGNVADANSRVAKLKQQERNYTVMDSLSTKPRLSYLARVRNPNPTMPDYYDLPLSTKEHLDRNGEEEHSQTHEPQAVAALPGAEKGAH
jgi:MoCo/4Fe-4S cofactor protein with predicted Tat translocation signal